MSSEETTANTSKTSGSTNDKETPAVTPKGAALIIGIAGGTGSGKTTIARKLKESYPPHLVQVIAQDSYYKDQSNIPLEDRPKTNYDHPDAYDNDLLMEHLDALRRGEEVNQPTYSFIAHTRCKETKLIKPAHILIVEGILALADERLRKRMDVKIFVQTDADVRFIRRLKRDIMERGRSLNDVIEQYQRVVRPMHMLYTEPTKRYADIIIPEGGSNAVAIGMVRAWIDQVVERANLGLSPRINYLGQEEG